MNAAIEIAQIMLESFKCSLGNLICRQQLLHSAASSTLMVGRTISFTNICQLLRKNVSSLIPSSTVTRGMYAYSTRIYTMTYNFWEWYKKTISAIGFAYQTMALSLGVLVAGQVERLYKLPHCRNGCLVLDDGRHRSEYLHEQSTHRVTQLLPALAFQHVVSTLL